MSTKATAVVPIDEHRRGQHALTVLRELIRCKAATGFAGADIRAYDELDKAWGEARKLLAEEVASAYGARAP